MTSPIDPIRRANAQRRARRSADAADETFDAGGSNLPAPVSKAYAAEPPHPAHGGAAIEAQILGQTGARRGLRAGPAVIDTAQHAYNKTEWSGKHDRRAPAGRVAKTDI
jgi:hypothetical protein